MAGLLFEWDEEKARKNESKHGVTFAEAKSVFNDSSAITFPDPDHSIGEERWLELGLADDGSLLVVCYTERRERIRIIGCRNATKAERARYGHGKFRG